MQPDHRMEYFGVGGSVVVIIEGILVEPDCRGVMFQLRLVFPHRLKNGRRITPEELFEDWKDLAVEMTRMGKPAQAHGLRPVGGAGLHAHIHGTQYAIKGILHCSS